MTDIGSVHFDNNVWNAPVPLSFQDLKDIKHSDAGAIVMKTVTLHPTQGNPDDYKLFDDHSMNNIALHNGGIDDCLNTLRKLFNHDAPQQRVRRLDGTTQPEKQHKPVFISLYGSSDEVTEMLDRITAAALPTDVLIEWNLSCPNVNTYLPSAQQLVKDVLRFRKHWSGKIGVKPPMEIDPRLMEPLFSAVDFITAINSVNGMGGRRIHEKAVHAVNTLARLTETPIIACGGAENRNDINRFLDAGACAVEMGTAYLRHGVEVFARDASHSELKDMLRSSGIFTEGDEFKLKSGGMSTMYFDFRLAPSLPDVWEKLILAVLSRIRDIEFDLVCGVPTGGVSLATIIAHRCRKPLIQCRTNAKNHGTEKLVEGVYRSKQRVLLIEDVVTTGTSTLLIARNLMSAGLTVNDVFCLLNRSANYNMSGINFRSLLRIGEFVRPRLRLRKYARTSHRNRGLEQLKSIIRDKNTKVCVSIDWNDPERVLNLLEQIAPYICMVKLHYDLLNVPTEHRLQFMERLYILIQNHNFAVFADRKLVDIPSIVEKQIITLARTYLPTFVTGYLHHGDSLEAYERTKQNVFLVASMSSASFGQADPLYVQRVISSARNNSIVAGVISQEKLDDNLFHLVPGIKLNAGTDGMGQKYRTPEDVKDFADVIIVGRGITEADDPVATVKEYRERIR